MMFWSGTEIPLRPIGCSDRTANRGGSASLFRCGRLGRLFQGACQMGQGGPYIGEGKKGSLPIDPPSLGIFHSDPVWASSNFFVLRAIRLDRRESGRQRHPVVTLIVPISEHASRGGGPSLKEEVQRGPGASGKDPPGSAQRVAQFHRFGFQRRDLTSGDLMPSRSKKSIWVGIHPNI